VKAILFGAGGMLGRDLQSQKPAEHEIIAFTHRDLDVRDARAIDDAIRSARPQWVINASGYTNVDGAAREPEMADAVNAVAVGEMARLCRQHDCVLLHYGTDYVFDGAKTGFYSEDDAPNPLSTYGRSKLNGEELARASGARYLIVRSQWLFGHRGSSFVSTIFEKAQKRVPTRAADDQHGCVTYSVDLARVSWAMIDQGLLGTYNVANRGRVSRYDLAKRIFEACDAASLLSGTSAKEFPAPPGAQRPANTPLDVRKVEAALGQRMPEWTDALSRYLGADSRREREGSVTRGR
jgi:dTDP-4-dehydrorhamnose reductase